MWVFDEKSCIRPTLEYQILPKINSYVTLKLRVGKYFPTFSRLLIFSTLKEKLLQQICDGDNFFSVEKHYFSYLDGNYTTLLLFYNGLKDSLNFSEVVGMRQIATLIVRWWLCAKMTPKMSKWRLNQEENIVMLIWVRRYPF